MQGAAPEVIRSRSIGLTGKCTTSNHSMTCTRSQADLPLLRSPISAPPDVSGSGPTLRSNISTTLVARRIQVKISGAACGAICTSDTASAPITAGPTPRIKALSHCKSFILESNGRIESIIKNDGRKIAGAAMAAPAAPAILYPTNAASIRIGPGVSWPSAKAVEVVCELQALRH